MSWVNRTSLVAAMLMLPVLVLAQTPNAAPAQDEAVATQEVDPAKVKFAIKLTGLVTFVANSCPDLVPNYDRFKAALGTLGLTTEDLAANEYKVEYLNYAAAYGADVKASCEKAEANFGLNGTTLPDLFAHK